MALQEGHAEAVNVYVNAILGSGLDLAIQKELLAAKSSNGAPGLFMAMKNRHVESVNAYIGAILSSDLAPEKKLSLAEVESDYFQYHIDKLNPTEILDIALIVSRKFTLKKFSPQLDKLVCETASEHLENFAGKEITWDTCLWIGLSYKPGWIKHESTHTELANSMIKEAMRYKSSESTEITPAAYLQDTLGKLINMQTKLAKDITKILPKNRLSLLFYSSINPGEGTAISEPITNP